MRPENDPANPVPQAVTPPDSSADASESNALAPLSTSVDPQAQPADNGPTTLTGWLRGQQENIITILLAVAFTIVIRAFVAEARWIPSESMVPSLLVGDRLMVEKVSYRFGEPHRGEIVVFVPPDYLGTKDAYIKRLIGLPGDTIEVRLEEGVFVNGQRLQEPYVADLPNASGYPFGDLLTLGDIPQYPLDEQSPNAPIVVPPGHYFMMGDNRNNSQDSHVWGFLPRENIIGRTFVRFWPLNRMKYFPEMQYPNVSGSNQPEQTSPLEGALSWVP
jgi:signal peptidase I